MRRPRYIWLTAITLVIVFTLPLYGFKSGGQPVPAPPGAPHYETLKQAIAEALPENSIHDSGSAGGDFAAFVIPYSRALLPVWRQIAFESEDKSLSVLARDVWKAEQSRITALQKWERTARPHADRLSTGGSAAFRRLLGEVALSTKDDMTTALRSKPDLCYVSAMIAQAEGAVDMAKVVLIFEGDEQLRTIARDLVAERQAEIRSLRSWLKERTTLMARR